MPDWACFENGGWHGCPLHRVSQPTPELPMAIIATAASDRWEGERPVSLQMPCPPRVCRFTWDRSPLAYG